MTTFPFKSVESCRVGGFMNHLGTICIHYTATPLVAPLRPPINHNNCEIIGTFSVKGEIDTDRLNLETGGNPI